MITTLGIIIVIVLGLGLWDEYREQRRLSRMAREYKQGRSQS